MWTKIISKVFDNDKFLTLTGTGEQPRFKIEGVRSRSLLYFLSLLSLPSLHFAGGPPYEASKGVKENIE